ncbi:efflux transporter outer membrane subunit [Pseudomonas sp. G.S.17]|uniref:efflux transporter outer membrane subunit n=1 Tax=Pseudomonas sp. G.S.17 TaxID=3137451 RepID=UPI00311CA972
MKPRLSVLTPCLLTLCLLLGACASPPPPINSGIAVPVAWQSPWTAADRQTGQQWWQQFDSPQLNRLIEQARAGSYDLAAAMARVRQARADSVIAGASNVPEITSGANANRQRLISGKGYRQLDAYEAEPTATFFDVSFSASYEVDFWGGNAATRRSAEQSLQASEFDQATVELTLLSAVADSYVQSLALDEQARIAELNLANAQHVLALVQTRFQSGSATALDLARQKSLVAGQQRQVPLIRQQAQAARITLATLLGQPVQQLTLEHQSFEHLNWPDASPGLPSELLSRRPDIASAEARLAAAQADIQVARAAMLPKLTLSASFGSGGDVASDILRSPFYNLGGGLLTPIFNNGRLGAERDKTIARQQELLETYRGAIISAFADVEKALNAIAGLDQQRQWQSEELQQAQRAFQIAESRYQAGAEDMLSVLDTQRTLYQAQEQSVQLRLSRLQASVALYKALGGGWRM